MFGATTASISRMSWMFISAICAARWMTPSKRNSSIRCGEWAIACHAMKWINSIRVRFALWATLLILAFLATFGAGVYFTFSRSLYRTVDEALVLSAQQVLASLSEDDGSLEL